MNFVEARFKREKDLREKGPQAWVELTSELESALLSHKTYYSQISGINVRNIDRTRPYVFTATLKDPKKGQLYS